MFQCTLRQLQVFERVSALLSYSRAAEQLYMSQPAVSMQIKHLEESVGMPLLERVGKKLFLTDAGREMRQCSLNVHEQLSQTDSKLDEMKELNWGTIRLAVVNTANYFIPQLLANFCREHPNVEVILQVANREMVLRHLAENSVDLAVLGAPPEDLDLQLDFLMDNPLVIIAHPEHPLCSTKKIPVERLEEECFISRELGSGTRKAMEQFFDEQGIQPHISMEMETNESIKQAVQAGMGLGILSSQCIELELETDRLVTLDVEGFPITRCWHVAHLTNKHLSSVADAFKAFLLGRSEASTDSKA